MDFDSLYLRALHYLEYRPRSEKEIRDYLQEKLTGVGYSKKELSESEKSLIEVIVHKLRQQKFLDDREFARIWVRSRTSYKPKGQRLVVLELRQKGISQDVINEVIQNQEVRIESDLDLAVAILEKKKKKYQDMAYQERFQKAGSMLARRGYDLDTIRKAIDQVFGK